MPRLRAQLLAVLDAAAGAEVKYRTGTHAPISSLLIDWHSSDRARQLDVVALESDSPFSVAHFFKTLAKPGCARLLCLNLREPLEQVPLILRCFEDWILAAKPELELDAALDAFHG